MFYNSVKVKLSLTGVSGIRGAAAITPARRRPGSGGAGLTPEQNRAVILEAASVVLGVQPDASMEDVAEGAALSGSHRHVYANFPSREALVDARQRAPPEVTAA